MKKYIYIYWDNATIELVDSQMASIHDAGFLELTEEEFKNYERVVKEYSNLQDWIQEKAKPNK